MKFANFISQYIPHRGCSVSLKTMDVTLNHYYDNVFKLSLVSGMWPFLKMRKKLLRVVFLVTVTICILITQIGYLFTCNRDLQCICESLTSSLLSIVVLVKVFTFQLNAHKMQQLIRHMFADWKVLETLEEYEIMKSYARSSKQFAFIYPIYSFATVCLFMSISIVPHILDIVRPLNELRPILLPYPGYYFVDFKKYFYYILGYAVASWEVIMVAIVSHDCMFVCYIEHVCSLFAVAGSRFEYLFCDHSEAMRELDGVDMYCKKIGFLVQMHQEALNFAQKLESIFTIPFAIQLLIGTIAMSITLLQIMRNSGYLESIRYIFYVIGQLIHLFCLSFEGQKLMDHSLKMREKIYNCSWYEAPVKSQKLLMLIMMQCLRPACLSAGKMYIFSLESFTTIMQTSMSYCTMLASLQ